MEIVATIFVIILLIIGGIIDCSEKNKKYQTTNNSMPPSIPFNIVVASTNDMLTEAISALTLNAYHINSISSVCLLYVQNHPTSLCFKFAMNNQKMVSRSALLQFQGDLNAKLKELHHAFHAKLTNVNLSPEAVALEKPAYYFGISIINIFVFNGYIYIESVIDQML